MASAPVSLQHMGLELILSKYTWLTCPSALHPYTFLSCIRSTALSQLFSTYSSHSFTAFSFGAHFRTSFRVFTNFSFSPLYSAFHRLALEKRKTLVIIIDEANYINNAVLNDLKILFNFKMDSRDRVVILLAGLPSLNNSLRLGIHEPLRQRIVMNYNLEGMTKEEGRSYIQAKLKGAGCTRTVFEDASVEAVLNAADGMSHIINKLCNASLLIGIAAMPVWLHKAIATSIIWENEHLLSPNLSKNFEKKIRNWLRTEKISEDYLTIEKLI